VGKTGPGPWYGRITRWGQTNITEIDPTRYDIPFWREHWKRTRTQGVILNAGGIVAYYHPSRYPLTHFAEHLGGRDLFGELVEAARADGLAVFARMDSNRVHEPFFVEHPDWMARDSAGKPYMVGGLYVTCIDSPYYGDYLPGVLREIAERYKPDGFTDNSWTGLDRTHISYSPHSRLRFREATGHDLPKKADWDDPVYRKWIKWSYARRLEVWDINNRVTREAGGPDCIWVGMTGGDMAGEAARFRDYKGICERTPMIMLDSQSRQHAGGFAQNGEIGKMIHGLLGWDGIVPESMAMYEHSHLPFRVASKAEPEARMWVVEGFAGGISPWWHHIGAYHEDRRQYATAERLFRWHEANEKYLGRRTPVASVGVLWSQENTDFYGRDDAQAMWRQPWLGATRAMIRARIPYVTVHADHVARDAAGLRVLILPNVGAVSDAQCAAIRRFAEGGGSVIASGETGLFDEWGVRRGESGLGSLLGVHSLGAFHGHHHRLQASWDDWVQHSYLRLTPQLRAGVYGPRTGAEPAASGTRHAVLTGFEQTDLLPFGGRLEAVAAEAGTIIPVSYVPPFPIFPPELSWMRNPDSTLPAVVLRELKGGGRTAYLAADLDRCFGRDNLPDHGLLLANIVKWAAGDSIPLRVEGRGALDCHLFRQEGRLILHIVNLTATESKPLHELIPVGPARVGVRWTGRKASGRLLVSGNKVEVHVKDGWAEAVVESIEDHEVLVVEGAE
jgi:hypothetical protein